MGVGDGWERSEEDQEFVWQLFREHPKVSDWFGLHESSLWTVEWETKTMSPVLFFQLLNLILRVVVFNLSSLLNFGLRVVVFAIITLPSYLI